MRTSLNSLSPVSRLRYMLEGSAWAVAYGAAVGLLWYGAYIAGPYLRSLG
ncbi:hypothetical protein UA11_04049 [Burkholderia multivorans]|nr:hypothetical protein UA11_04049 [Burkholderia multivorans]